MLTVIAVAILVISFGLFYLKEERALRYAEETGTSIEDLVQTKRAESLSAIIRRHATNIPSVVLDGQFVEYTYGSGRLGPSEYQFYARITIKPDDVPLWINTLKEPFNNTREYSEPKSKKDWWLPKTVFDRLKLYETKTYFGRSSGWIAADESTGHLYVYTFTM